MQPDELEYVGFWARFGAFLIDSILLVAILSAWTKAWSIMGPNQFTGGLADFMLKFVFSLVAIILFWVYKQATPGKMVASAKIVDARTGDTPSTGQFVGRYFAYIISTLPFWLGFIWIAFDARKQGWHDKLAGTVVVRKPRKGELRREELQREPRRGEPRREDN